MVTEINDLNDDCLIHIFSFLSIIDRFKVKKVCTRWNALSSLAWQTLKTISIQRDFWGLSNDTKLVIDRNIFKRILQICGRYIIAVDLSAAEQNGQPDRNIRVKSCKYIFMLIHELCPNVRYINAGEPNSENTLEYVALHFDNLTHFAVTISDSFEDLLSQLFLRNQSLRYMRFKGSSIIGKCLLHLNAEVLEEFHFVDCFLDEPQYFIDAFEKFKNIRTLILARITVPSSWISLSVQAICKNAESIKCLYLQFYNNWYAHFVYSTFIANFKNLERLHIGGELLDNMFLSAVGLSCTKLKHVQIQNTDTVTDTGMLSIVSLPELRYLRLINLDRVTDRVLGDIPKLQILEVHRCPEVRIDGLAKLLRSSLCIQSLRFTCCNISASKLFEEALNNKCRNLMIKLDNSDSENSELVDDVQTLFKCNDYIIKRVKQLCYRCFKSPNKNCRDCHNFEEVLKNNIDK